jgi:hypothetical protein
MPTELRRRLSRESKDPRPPMASERVLERHREPGRPTNSVALTANGWPFGTNYRLPIFLPATEPSNPYPIPLLQRLSQFRGLSKGPLVPLWNVSNGPTFITPASNQNLSQRRISPLPLGTRSTPRWLQHCRLRPGFCFPSLSPFRCEWSTSSKSHLGSLSGPSAPLSHELCATRFSCSWNVADALALLSQLPTGRTRAVALGQSLKSN